MDEEIDSVGIAKAIVDMSETDQTNVQLCIDRGVTMADLFGAVLMKSSGEGFFDREMSEFLDGVAGTIGDFIGAACSDPQMVVGRFGDVLVSALARRIEPDA